MSLMGSQIEVGKSYLHRNWLFVRTVEHIEGDTVFYHDQYGVGRCTKKVFIRQCIAFAPKDARGMDEIKADQVRESKQPQRTRTEFEFQALCDEAKQLKNTHICIEDPRQLGGSYEEVMRSLLIVEEYRLYLRIMPSE